MVKLYFFFFQPSNSYSVNCLECIAIIEKKGFFSINKNSLTLVNFCYFYFMFFIYRYIFLYFHLFIYKKKLLIMFFKHHAFGVFNSMYHFLPIFFNKQNYIFRFFFFDYVKLPLVIIFLFKYLFFHLFLQYFLCFLFPCFFIKKQWKISLVFSCNIHNHICYLNFLIKCYEI